MFLVGWKRSSSAITPCIDDVTTLKRMQRTHAIFGPCEQCMHATNSVRQSERTIGPHDTPTRRVGKQIRRMGERIWQLYFGGIRILLSSFRSEKRLLQNRRRVAASQRGTHDSKQPCKRGSFRSPVLIRTPSPCGWHDEATRSQHWYTKKK